MENAADRLFRCTRCVQGVDIYHDEEEGRTVQDACYHCGATGWVDADTHRHDRLQSIVARFAAQEAHARRRAIDAYAATEPGYGEDFAFAAAENMMTEYDYLQEMIMSYEDRFSDRMAQLPGEMQDVLLAWDEALTAEAEERAAEAARREPPVGSWAATARLMASIGGDDDFDWDRWKDEMKEGEPW